MKNFGACLIVFLFCVSVTNIGVAQGGMWTWVHGDSIQNSMGNPGVMGIADPGNIPPAMYEPCYWIDNNDNLWIYGGFRATGQLYAALWKYNPYTNLWTWVQGSSTPNQNPVYGTQGIPSPSNTPGSRNCSLTWTDANGNLWMMGGYTIANATLGDLWKLDTTTLEWTWMNGSTLTGVTGNLVLGIPSSTNYPRAVAETACAWTDSQDNLWYYGGIKSYYLSYFDEVTKYNIATNEWTHVRGTAVNSQPVHGIQGIPAPTNDPGSRIVYAHWKDAADDFWFMNGSTVFGSAEDHNDVWKYNHTTNEWTWMAGPQAANEQGSYNTFCNSSTGDHPAARSEDKAVYKDSNNRVWMYGGTTANSNDNFNDLWVFSPDSLQYKWIHGTNSINQAGVYGQLNVPSPLNIPHSRDGAILFGDSLCNIFLYGGITRHPTGTFNDVWKFSPDTSCIPCNMNVPTAMFSAPGMICPGTCTDFTNLSNNATSYQWTFPGATPFTSTDVNPLNICYNLPGSYDVTLIASGPNGSDTLLIVNYITVYPYPAAQSIAQSGDTLFANAGSVSYQWYYNGNVIPGATNYLYVASQSGNYNVLATDSNGCEVEAAIFDVIAAVSPLSFGEGSGVRLFPNPVTKELKIKSAGLIIGTATEISIYSVLSQKIFTAWPSPCLVGANEQQQEVSFDVSKLPAGIYFLELFAGEKIFHAQFVKSN